LPPEFNLARMTRHDTATTGKTSFRKPDSSCCHYCHTAARQSSYCSPKQILSGSKTAVEEYGGRLVGLMGRTSPEGAVRREARGGGRTAGTEQGGEEGKGGRGGVRKGRGGGKGDGQEGMKSGIQWGGRAENAELQGCRCGHWEPDGPEWPV